MARQPEVDTWLAGYENPMKPVVQRMREIVLEADPRMDECIKWQAPTFTYKGNLASFYPKRQDPSEPDVPRRGPDPRHVPTARWNRRYVTLDEGRNLDEAEAARPELESIVRAWCDWRDGESP